MIENYGWRLRGFPWRRKPLRQTFLRSRWERGEKDFLRLRRSWEVYFNSLDNSSLRRKSCFSDSILWGWEEDKSRACCTSASAIVVRLRLPKILNRGDYMLHVTRSVKFSSTLSSWRKVGRDDKKLEGSFTFTFIFPLPIFLKAPGLTSKTDESLLWPCMPFLTLARLELLHPHRVSLFPNPEKRKFTFLLFPFLSILLLLLSLTWVFLSHRDSWSRNVTSSLLYLLLSIPWEYFGVRSFCSPYS